MTKRKTTTDPQPDVKLVILQEIFDLLKENKITQLLSWKELSKKPEIIEVGVAGNEETILVKCKTMDRQGFGYLPNGYPEHLKATGKVTRFTVEKLNNDEPEQTDSESGKQPEEEQK